MTLLTEQAVALPLKVWQDPQGDVVLHHSRSECAVYFGCWVAAGEPANYLCKLTFHHAWAVRGFCLEFLPYKIKENNYHSKIFLIEDSQWLKQMGEQRLRNYPEWKNWDEREHRHYVVSGHDNYYEIIATDYDEATSPYDEAGGLRRLIDET